VIFRGNSPGLISPLVLAEVVPDATWTVHLASLAVKVDPETVTVVWVVLEPDAALVGVAAEPDCTFETVYPAERSLDW